MDSRTPDRTARARPRRRPCPRHQPSQTDETRQTGYLKRARRTMCTRYCHWTFKVSLLSPIARVLLDRHFDHRSAPALDDDLESDLVADGIDASAPLPGLRSMAKNPLIGSSTGEWTGHPRGDLRVDPAQHPTHPRWSLRRCSVIQVRTRLHPARPDQDAEWIRREPSASITINTSCWPPRVHAAPPATTTILGPHDEPNPGSARCDQLHRSVGQSSSTISTSSSELPSRAPSAANRSSTGGSPLPCVGTITVIGREMAGSAVLMKSCVLRGRRWQRFHRPGTPADQPSPKGSPAGQVWADSHECTQQLKIPLGRDLDVSDHHPRCGFTQTLDRLGIIGHAFVAIGCIGPHEQHARRPAASADRSVLRSTVSAPAVPARPTGRHHRESNRPMHPQPHRHRWIRRHRSA